MAVHTTEHILANGIEYWVTTIPNPGAGKNLIHKEWANNRYISKELISDFADRHPTAEIIANASGFHSTGMSVGLQITDGVFYKNFDSTNRYPEAAVIFKDGTMKIVYAPIDPDQLIRKGAWHSFHFGPYLIDNGVMRPRGTDENTLLTDKNPRQGIGQTANGDFIIITVDGREGDSVGVDAWEFAQLFMDRGCTVAYNLDGGGSAQLVENGTLLNTPSDGAERATGEYLFVDGTLSSEEDLTPEEPIPDVPRDSNTTLKDLSLVQVETDRPKVDWLKHRIQPFMLLEMPGSNGTWLEFPLGIFLLSTPTRREENGLIYREVEAYDKLTILNENKNSKRLSIVAGERYYDFIVRTFTDLNITKWNVEYTEKTATTTTEWEIGTEYLRILNDVFAALNYTPVFVDEYGYFTSRLYKSPQDKPIDVEYVADEFSVIEDGTTEELDTFNVPNAWLIVLNDPERDPLVTYVENNNPDSPTSYQSRGNRRIVEKEEVQDIADQEALDAYGQRKAFEASQIFGKVHFSTALMPIHGYSDVINLINDTLQIEGKYAETSWSMDLTAGGSMSHDVRAVVDIG